MKYSESNIKEFNTDWINMDISNKCALACPKCDRAFNPEAIENKVEITVKDFEKIAKFFNRVDFCGQLSDPIYHSDLPGILNACVKHNTSANIHTAAHGRTDEWWDNIFNISKKINGCRWLFAIDGLPEESHKYRINQNGVKAFERLKQAVDSLGSSRVTWRYIIFRYNEDHIEEAKELANKYNIQIEFVKSNRWTNEFDPYLPLNKDYYVDKF